MTKNFNEAMKARRSIYSIGKETPISNQRIEEIINEGVKHTPSAFNSQSARVIVLFGEHHNKLWDITLDTLRKIVPADAFSATEDKINSFSNGYGTILFFEDHAVIDSLQAHFPLYKDKFPVWSLQSSGMLQYVIWTSLATEGLGASLQHYNPLIDDAVKAHWNIPSHWELVAEMPFGNITAAPGEKTFEALENRIKVFK